MSSIDDLVAEQCPDGVKFEALGELVDRSATIRWRDVGDTEFRYIDLTSVDRATHTISGTAAITRSNAPSRAQQIVRAGDVLFGTTRPMLKRYCVVPAEYDGQIASTGYCILRPKIDRLLTRFLFYVLGTDDFYAFVEANERGASYPAISDAAVKGYRIPVPPIQVQREIVTVLDRFAESKADLELELGLELEARRNQYLHYRDSLLSMDEKIEMRPLGDLAANLDRQRKPVTKSSRVMGKIPYYGASGIVDYVQDYIFDGDYLLISEDGANLLARSTPIAFSVSGKSWINNHAHVLQFGTYAERRFVEFYLNSIDLKPFISGAAQPKLNKANLNRILVPDPPLSDKERVVKVLDSFDSLVSRLAESLQAEAQARRTQYEHYRDKLLSFKELPA